MGSPLWERGAAPDGAAWRARRAAAPQAKVAPRASEPLLAGTAHPDDPGVRAGALSSATRCSSAAAAVRVG
jgi:hypothetical protein